MGQKVRAAAQPVDQVRSKDWGMGRHFRHRRIPADIEVVFRFRCNVAVG
jgi:hypothetical protein